MSTTKADAIRPFTFHAPQAARSGLPRTAGLKRSTPASPTSTRSTAVDTSRHGRSRSSFQKKFAQVLDHCANSGSRGSPQNAGHHDLCTLVLDAVDGSSAAT
jgi:hypothetical protein